MEFYGLLADFINDGFAIASVLEKLYKQASENGKKPKEMLAIVYDDIRLQLREGKMLSDALSRWASSDEIYAISSGERAGSIPMALKRLIYSQEAKKRISGAIVGALSYPIVVFMMAIGLLWFYGHSVIPEFISILPIDRWTGTAYALGVSSMFVKKYIFFVLLFIGSLSLIIWLSIPRWRGMLRKQFDKIPPWSFYKLSVGSTFLISISSLLKAGIALEESLLLIRDRATPWLQERLEPIILLLRKGVPLGKALSDTGYNFPDKKVILLIEMYSEASSYSDALEKLAIRWLDDGVKLVEKQGKILNMFALSLVAFAVGLMYLGMFDLQSQLQQALQSR